jgi:hypothetical protein
MACLSPEPPRQTSSATPPIGEFCVVIYNNAFIDCITHNPLLPSRASGNGEGKDTEALEVPLRKESRVFLSPPLLPSRASGNGEARTLRHSKCPCGKRVGFFYLPPFAFESLRQRGSAVRHAIWVENRINRMFRPVRDVTSLSIFVLYPYSIPKGMAWKIFLGADT